MSRRLNSKGSVAVVRSTPFGLTECVVVSTVDLAGVNRAGFAGDRLV